MKNKLIIILTMLFSNFYCINLFAQSDSLLPYPVKNLINPSVCANVQKNTNGYVFTYQIKNGQGAIKSIHKFMAELNAPVKPFSAPRDWTLWKMDYDTIQVATWFSEDSIADIGVGEIITGFSFESIGLPKICRCWFSAMEIVEGEEGVYNPATASIFTTSLQRTTLGPVGTPSPFIPLNFIDIISSYKHQALALNWIADRKDEKDDDDDKEDEGQGVVRKLDRRLDNAHKALIKKDTSKAREEMLKFVKKVEKLYGESCDHEKNGREKEKYTFTSEAYALLKYNAEYLIQQLPEKKHKGEKEKD